MLKEGVPEIAPTIVRVSRRPSALNNFVSSWDRGLTFHFPVANARDVKEITRPTIHSDLHGDTPGLGKSSRVVSSARIRENLTSAFGAKIENETKACILILEHFKMKVFCRRR